MTHEISNLANSLARQTGTDAVTLVQLARTTLNALAATTPGERAVSAVLRLAAELHEAGYARGAAVTN